MDIIGIHGTEISHTAISMGSDQNLRGTPQMASVMARMMLHQFICAIKILDNPTNVCRKAGIMYHLQFAAAVLL